MTKAASFAPPVSAEPSVKPLQVWDGFQHLNDAPLKSNIFSEPNEPEPAASVTVTRAAVKVNFIEKKRPLTLASVILTEPDAGCAAIVPNGGELVAPCGVVRHGGVPSDQEREKRTGGRNRPKGLRAGGHAVEVGRNAVSRLIIYYQRYLGLEDARNGIAVLLDVLVLLDAAEPAKAGLAVIDEVGVAGERRPDARHLAVRDDVDPAEIGQIDIGRADDGPFRLAVQGHAKRSHIRVRHEGGEDALHIGLTISFFGLPPDL